MTISEIIIENILKFITNRLLMLAAVILILFYILSSKLFDLQIVEGEDIKNSLTGTIQREVVINSQRGTIYDRYGRPLAVNQVVYNVKIDAGISMKSQDLNKVLLNFIKLAGENQEELADDFPISQYPPYEYTFYGENIDGKKKRWLTDMGFELKDKEPSEYPEAAEVMAALKVQFDLKEEEEDGQEPKGYLMDITEQEARNIISLRSQMFMVRFYSYKPVTIATNVGIKTVTRIEEDAEKYKSIFVDTEAIRYYPYGEYLSHIIGYVRKISADDVEKLQNKLKEEYESADGKMTEAEYNERKSELEKRYDLSTDIYGQTGIESAFEDDLRGEKGSQTIVVNVVGRKVDELSEGRIEPVQGSNVFLTIDAEFQKRCYEIIEESLVEMLISEMTNNTRTGSKITPQQFLSSMIKANNISAKEVFESGEGTTSERIKAYVVAVFAETPEEDGEEDREEPDYNSIDGQKKINAVIAEGIEEGHISVKEGILLLFEQGIITGEEDLQSFHSGKLSATGLLINKLKEGEITPAMTNLDPSTGNLVVVDLKTGDILAAPSYPAYDINEVLANWNQNYPKLLMDATAPLNNRPFTEGIAPGSTFKMITAVAGLETGVITPRETIYDEVVFKRAGKPEPSCMSKAGHGPINAAQAIEVSCNYFFFEAAYRMGNAKEGNKLDSINSLNEYMSLFSLDESSGVEIGAKREKSYDNLSSPQKKLKRTGEDWYDGDTIRTAIGQGENEITSAVMARYISILATKGENRALHLMQKVVGENGETRAYEPVVTNVHDKISETTWNVVHEGMRNVIIGSRGTGRGIYAGFPIEVAGKTGTAEQGNKLRPDHTSFAGFAPYDDPEIAIYVSMPFSDTKTMPSLATSVSKKVLAEYFKLERSPETGLKQNTIVE